MRAKAARRSVGRLGGAGCIFADDLEGFLRRVADRHLLLLLGALPTAGAMDATPGGIRAPPITMMLPGTFDATALLRRDNPPPQLCDFKHLPKREQKPAFHAARINWYAEDHFGSSLEEVATQRFPDVSKAEAVNKVYKQYREKFTRDQTGRDRTGRDQTGRDQTGRKRPINDSELRRIRAILNEDGFWDKLKDIGDRA